MRSAKESGHSEILISKLGREYQINISYIKNNKDTIKKFTKAINKGLKYVQKKDSKTIAKELVEFFPDMTINDLDKMIKRYKENDAE